MPVTNKTHLCYAKRRKKHENGCVTSLFSRTAKAAKLRKNKNFRSKYRFRICNTFMHNVANLLSKTPPIATFHKILHVQDTCFLALDAVLYAAPSKKSVNLVRLVTNILLTPSVEMSILKVRGRQCSKKSYKR